MNASLVGWTEGSGRLDAVIEESASIGAARDNAIVVRTDGVSGHHAKITRQDGTYVIEDAGSRNGTWVNGERVTRARLKHLDVVTLGRFADLVFLERAREGAAVEQRAAAPAVADAEMPADLEWRTRLVWSPEELADLRAAGLMPWQHKPAASSKPAEAGKPSSPSADRASASAEVTPERKPESVRDSALAESVSRQPGSVPPPESEPPPIAAEAPETPAVSPERTVFVPGGAITMPPSIVAESDEGPRTQLHPSGFRSAGLSVPPDILTPQEGTEFHSGGTDSNAGLTPPGLLADTRADSATPDRSGDAAAAPPTQLPASQANEPPPTRLPTGSVLGFRDVGPPTSSTTTPAADQTRLPSFRATPASPGMTARGSGTRIRAVKLSGDFGEFELPVGRSSVGRSSEATVRIDSREMSRIHAILLVTPETVTVEDQGSANGTSVNGAAIEGVRRLIDGDRLAFANYEFRVELLRLEGDR